MRPILHQQQPFYKTPWGHCLGQCVPWKQKGLASKDTKIGEFAAVFRGCSPCQKWISRSIIFCWKICRKLHLPLGQKHPNVCLNEFSPKFSFCLDVGILTDLQPKFEKCPRCCFILYLCWYELCFHFCGSRWIPNSNCFFSEQTIVQCQTTNI